MPKMEEIKELITSTLEQKRVLSRLKVRRAERDSRRPWAVKSAACMHRDGLCCLEACWLPGTTHSLTLTLLAWAVQAELRVQVFLAIDEQEKNSGNDGGLVQKRGMLAGASSRAWQVHH